jgi:hypothetical protein
MYIKIMNICCLKVVSKLRLKLRAAYHMLTAPKAFPDPYAFFQRIYFLATFFSYIRTASLKAESQNFLDPVLAKPES